jgi:hypothetical protein
MRKNKFHCLPFLIQSGQGVKTPACLEPIYLKENRSVITQWLCNYVYYINECNRLMYYINECNRKVNFSLSVITIEK